MRAERNIVVEQHDSPAGKWEMVRAEPAPWIAPFVGEYQGYREYSVHRVRRREPAYDAIPVIISFDCAFDILADGNGCFDGDGTGSQHSWRKFDTFVAGLNDSYAVVDSFGGAYCMQVDFSPLGAMQFFDMPLSELRGRVVAMRDVLGRDADLMVEALYCAPDWPTRFDILESVIAKRLQAGRQAPVLISHSWALLQRYNGRLAIEDLAAHTGRSREHLSRQCREWLGLAPKALARIVRFQRVLACIKAGTGLARRADWSTLAFDWGYADQSHMIRDFRDLAGITPVELSSLLIPGGGIVEH